MGIIGGLGAVLAAPLAIAASHHDQRDATYVSVIPIGCKVEPGGGRDAHRILWHRVLQHRCHREDASNQRLYT